MTLSSKISESTPNNFKHSCVILIYPVDSNFDDNLISQPPISGAIIIIAEIYWLDTSPGNSKSILWKVPSTVNGSFSSLKVRPDNFNWSTNSFIGLSCSLPLHCIFVFCDKKLTNGNRNLKVEPESFTLISDTSFWKNEGLTVTSFSFISISTPKFLKQSIVVIISFENSLMIIVVSVSATLAKIKNLCANDLEDIASTFPCNLSVLIFINITQNLFVIRFIHAYNRTITDFFWNYQRYHVFCVLLVTKSYIVHIIYRIIIAII